MTNGMPIETLGNVCEFVRGPFGGSLKKNCFKPTGYAVYEQQHAIYDQFEDIRYFVDEAKFNEMKRFELKPGDLIMSCSGTMGKVAIVPEGVRQGIINQALLKLTPETNLNAEYLRYWMDSDDFLARIAQHSKGAAIKNVASVKVLKTISFPFPPLPEQERIVAVLDKAFAAIDKAKANVERNLQNAQELFQSKLNEVFSHKGEGWEESKIDELTERVTKGSSPKWQGINYVDNPGVLFVTSENVVEGGIVLKKRKYVEERFNEKDKKSILQKGDVLTNIVGASIGRTAVYELDDVANINQAVCLIRCNGELLNNYYLMDLLNSPFFKDILHDNEVNTARANLSLTFFKELVIPVPPIKDQEKIVGQVAKLRRTICKAEANLERKIVELDNLKKSILQKAFSGEL